MGEIASAIFLANYTMEMEQKQMQPQYIGQPQQYVPVQPIQQPMNGQIGYQQQPMQPMDASQWNQHVQQLNQQHGINGMNGNAPQAYQQPQGYIQPPQPNN